MGSVLHSIPCLSEHYIAMNDDYFFTAPVLPHNFFHFHNGEIEGPTAVQEGGEVLPGKGQMCHNGHHHPVMGVNSALMMSRIPANGSMLHKFRRMQHEPFASSVSAHQYILERMFQNETAAHRTHRFRTKTDFHVEALAFNIALNADRLNLSNDVWIGKPSSLRYAFRAFNTAHGVKIFEALKKTASNVQFMGINDDMGESPVNMRNMMEFYMDLWPVAAPWEINSKVKGIFSKWNLTLQGL